MLDKSIQNEKIVMKLDACDNIRRSEVLPKDFSFRFYRENDAEHWARIETSVDEFDEEKEAVDYYSKEFIPHTDELKRRCVFVCNPAGLPVGTGTAWYCVNNGKRYSQLHWIAVCPEYQKMGLGKAVVQRVLNIFQEIAPDTDVWLSSQTWSHDAVWLYHCLGFRIMREESIVLHINRDMDAPKKPYNIDAAMDILKDVYDPPLFQEMLDRMQ